MKLRVQRFGNMRFRHPADWVAEVISDMNGMLVMDPEIENEWQANLFLELSVDRDGLDLAGDAAALGRGLAANKLGFELVDLRRETHASGREYNVVEYQSMQDGVELHQWEILMVLDGPNRLHITAASQRDLWGKFEPIFASTLDSLRFDA